jgi:antigen flippase
VSTSLAATPATTPPAAPAHTYTQILKATALVGGSSVLNVAFGIVRTKAMAVLLGPSGVGLMGLYGSIVDLAQSLAGMGIQNSAVREIAAAVGSGDADRIERTAAVVKRVSIVLGTIGALLLIALAAPVSQMTFGSSQQTAGVAMLSLAVFFRIVSAGQGAVIQGMRRVSDFAAMSAAAPLFGTLVTIPLIYVFREQGVVPSLIAVAGVTMLASWWYGRKARLRTPPLAMVQVGRESMALLKLGVAFMASGLMMMGSAYAIRIIVLHQVGVEGSGLYQSAWTLGGLYVGFILQAMGTDFYPRLTACAEDNAACNRLVNEQAQVGVLLGGPGVMATLTFAPLVLTMFYTAQFGGAVDVLRWICLGIALRLITWPMGFIILAKGRQDLFFWTELAWTAVTIGLTWFCVEFFGLAGAGIAFFGSYVFHGFLIYPIVRRLTGFRWSADNTRTTLLFLSMTAAVFWSVRALPSDAAVLAGTAAAGASALYSIRGLRALVSLK